MIKVTENEVLRFNETLMNILYNNIKIENIYEHKTVILVICENLEKLGILKVNLKNKEYEYNFPKFLTKTFCVNIFYLFPKDYSISKFKTKYYDEYLDICITGIDLLKNYMID